MSSWYERNVSRVIGNPAPAPTAPAPQGYPQQPSAFPATSPVRQPLPAPPQPSGEEAPPGQMHITDAIQVWKGGAGNAETMVCPRCGGRNVFSRASGAIIGSSGQKSTPAPHCFECGWNGMWEQFSDQFD